MSLALMFLLYASFIYIFIIFSKVQETLWPPFLKIAAHSRILFVYQYLIVILFFPHECEDGILFLFIPVPDH